jgi:hypothetical protein
MGCVFFISHRHADKRIADIFESSLRDWGVPEEDIYYSSKIYGDQKPGLGEAIHPAVCKAVAEARLFILVYTFGTDDWAWCMHELGLAIDARAVGEGRPSETQIVIIQCTQDEPKLLRETKRVTIDIDNLRDFIRLVLCDYPTKDDPYRKKLHDDTLNKFAQELCNHLRDVIPSARADEYYRWDHFTLGMDADDVQAVKKMGKPPPGEPADEARLKQIRECAEVRESFGGAMRHFGWKPVKRRGGTRAGRDDLRHTQKTLGFLIDKWKEETAYSGDEDPRWAVELLEELGRAIRETDSEPHAQFMKSVYERKADYFYPIVNHARVQQDKSMEFIVYMYRFERTAPWLNESAIEK